VNLCATFRVLLIVACSVGAADLRAAEPPFSISIADPGRPRPFEDRSEASHFHVVIRNISNEAQRIWQERNSWGYYSLSFELADASGKRWVASKRKDMRWSVNGPGFENLGPGEVAVLEVYFGNGEVWEGFPLQKGKHERVQLKAIFEVGESPESKEYRVWTGHIESKPIEVQFVRWR
jgi:hypothetical protein